MGTEHEQIRDVRYTGGVGWKHFDVILALERSIPAARSAVFRAFTDPDELAEWWGPAGFTVPSLAFSPRVGDGYRIEMQPPEGEAFYLSGEFRVVDPPSRLAYTFTWEEPDPNDVETLVELLFRDLEGSTKVLLTQGPFKTEPRRELHRNGWTDALKRLERLCSQQPENAPDDH